VRRGEVWWVHLAPRSGSEQGGRRPAIVVSHDSLASVETWRSIVVVPLTTSDRASARGPTVPEIPAGDGGLGRSSGALCHQVTTLDRATFLERAGSLSPASLRAVEQGLLVALDLATPPGAKRPRA
jgi:mRNA interferase MazF